MHPRDKKGHGSLAYGARTLETVQLSINKAKKVTGKEMNPLQLHVRVWIKLSRIRMSKCNAPGSTNGK